MQELERYFNFQNSYCAHSQHCCLQISTTISTQGILFCLVWDLKWTKELGMFSLASGFFHSPFCLWDPSTLLCLVAAHSHLCVVFHCVNRPQYIYLTSYHQTVFRSFPVGAFMKSAVDLCLHFNVLLFEWFIYFVGKTAFPKECLRLCF